MTQTNKNNLTQHEVNIPVYQPAYQDDEIDLRELLKVIWDYKWLTVFMCAVAIVGSIFYALNAQEWWVAKGKVIAPQINDVATLYSQSKKVGAILNAGNSSSNNKKEMKDFIDLFEPDTLFKNFINAFNSSVNKKVFLEKNSVFIEYLKENNIKVPSKELSLSSLEERQKYSKVLNDWMTEINASLNSEHSELSLSFKTSMKESSAELLNAYIVYISKTVKDNQFEKFLMFVESSKQELEISVEMSEVKVQQKLARLLKKTEYAYQIASQSNLVDYQTNVNPNEELFQINLGEKALKAKIKVLKSIKDLSILDPSISQMQITLDTLNNLKFVDDRSFSPFRYLEIVEPPLARAAPKRALIVILSTLLAGMLSIFIALVHYFMTKKEV